MINVLVTGANGQLGHCIKDLEGHYPDLNFIYTDYPDLDICNENAVIDFFEKYETIDYCINCAAYTAVDKAEEDKEKAFNINVLGPKHLALTCRNNDTVLIHISTDFVFDGKKTEPYVETDTPNPISVYGDTKLNGEIEIQNILRNHFILRTSWLYSEHGQNFMKTMLRLAKTHDELSVVSDQMGTPTYAGDLAEVIMHIIQTRSNKYGTYHYSNEGEISWFEFAEAIFEERRIAIKVKPIMTIDYPTLAKRPKFSVLDKSKIKNNIDITILNWKDSLKKSLRLYQE